MGRFAQRGGDSDAAGCQIVRHTLPKVGRLRAWGYEATLAGSAIEALLDEGVPVIACVWTPMLEYRPVETSHVVLVVGYGERNVFLNDPTFADETHAVPWNVFLVAWAEFDETAVIVRPAAR